MVCGRNNPALCNKSSILPRLASCRKLSEPPYPSNYIVKQLRVIEIQHGKKVLYEWRQQHSEAAKRQAIAEGEWTYPDNPGWTPDFKQGPYLADCVNRIFFEVYTSGSKVTMQPRGRFGGGGFPGKACSLAGFEGLED